MNGSITPVKRVFARGPDSGEYAEVGWLLVYGITNTILITTTTIATTTTTTTTTATTNTTTTTIIITYNNYQFLQKRWIVV